jgi:bacillopeptidase F
VVNNSWSTDSAGCDRTFHFAVRAWRALDIVPVFAAGNSAVAVSPANYPESLAVGAVDRSNEVAYFSGRGPSSCDGRLYPDVVAPGTQVRSAWPGGTRKNLAGTSMATPHVTGTVALIRSQKPTMTAAAIINVLRATAVELGPRGPDNFYGHGLVDAFRAFNCLQYGTASGCVAACP